MAAAVSGPGATYTPPASSHGRHIVQSGDWHYSVPIDGVTTPEHSFREKSGNSTPHRSHVPPKPNAAPLANGDSHSPMPAAQPNGYHDARSGNKPGSDDYLAAPPRNLLVQRHDSSHSSNPDGDSVFDLYGGGHSTVSADSHSQEDELVHYGNGSGHVGEEEPESSKWIHRDKLEGREEDPHSSKWIDREKLARIENAEVEDYLWNEANSRWIHKDKLEEIESMEMQQAGINLGENVRRDRKDQRLHSPSPTEDMYNHDPRSPEERAAEQRRLFQRNPSYSRIPLASASPIPVPMDFLERRQPLPRSATTPTGSDDGARPMIVPPSARKRSYSAGSAMLLADSDKTAPPIPAPNGTISNPKNSSRTPVSPNVNGRRTSSARNTSLRAKHRTRSNPQLYRPTTSASYAANSPPVGSKAPDGPPPWAMSGYKPDPSLPPDQQIIPTIARKMQQEQWERDGVAASVYDRDLRPLKPHNSDEVEKRKHISIDQGDADEKSAWPLSPSSASPPEPKAKKETPPPPKDGGYRAMPNISAQTEPPQSPPPVQRVPDVPEEEPKSKKKMCCCVIM